MTQLLKPSVVDLLGHLGSEVDCGRRIPLEGRHSFWLVTDGTLDIFAVDTGEGGRWQFVGKADAGTILSAPVRGPKHALVGRSRSGTAVREIHLKELLAAQKDSWIRTDGLSQEERALAQGIDAGVRIVLGFARDGLPPREFVPLRAGTEVELTAGQQARSERGVLWINVGKGKVATGGTTGFRLREAGDWVTVGEQGWISCDTYASLRVTDTETLLAEGTLWQNLLSMQTRALYTVDRAMERRNRRENERIVTARAAGEDVRERADEALRAVLRSRGRTNSILLGADENATVAACRLAAAELGITVVAPEVNTTNIKVGPIERVALRSRFRTRTITLKGQWWRDNVGPLVGHRVEGHSPVALLWRRGRYHAVDPQTQVRTPLTATAAGAFEDRAVMLYRPLPEKPVRSWQLLLFGLRGSLGDLRTLLLGTGVAVLLGLLVPIATGKVLGEYVPSASSSLIVQVCCALIVASLVSAAFGLLQNIALLRFEGRFESTLQAAVWDRLLRLPATFFTRYSTGELASAALGVKHIRAVLMGVSSIVLQSSVVALFNFLLLFWYSVPLALMAGGFMAASGIVFTLLGLKQMRWQRKSLEIGHRLTNKVFQTLRGLPKLRVAAAENRAYGDWAADFVQEKEYQKRIGRYQTLITTFDKGYVPFCTLILFMVLSGPASGMLTVSEFLAFNAAFAIMLASLTQLTSSLMSVITVVPMYNRLKPVLTEPLEVSSASTVPGELSGDLEVNHLTFGYGDDSPPVLDDISFHIQPGEFVAVVGPSGCGKSTLLRVLLGFEKPLSGTVLYDGQDLSSLDISAVRSQCGVVLQQAKPTSGSIFEAIAGAQNYSMDEAWEAAEMAGIAKDIRAMPMGMHTQLSDGGTLSGGQRQRLVIAHALIRKPRLLFFDEATSALDNETQRTVTESTRRLQATRIVIAHRMSTVMDADKVIVLDGGRIAQFGTPAELLADTSGLFHQLVRRQMQ